MQDFKTKTYIGYGLKLFYWDIITALKENKLSDDIYNYLYGCHYKILKCYEKINEYTQCKYCRNPNDEITEIQKKIKENYDKIIQCLRLYFMTHRLLTNNDNICLKIIEFSPSSNEKEDHTIAVGFLTPCIENELISIMNQKFKKEQFKQLFGEDPIFIAINTIF